MPSETVEKRLLQEGVFFLTGEINEESTQEVMAWIQYQNLTSKKKKLTLFINSGGGNLYDAFALIDVMRASRLPVNTVGIGSIMSAAFLIFVCGRKRYISPNTSIMCHEYSEIVEGKHHDIMSSMKEAELCNAKMLDILVDQCKMTDEEVAEKLLNPTDIYLTPDELLSIGGADAVYSAKSFNNK
jgi:ATP-dependent Clp protease protease subunit